MKRTIIYISTILLILFTGSYGFSAIKVQSIKGSVAYKLGTQWQPLKVGMNLKEGTKISTGARSSAVIKIDDHQLTIRQLTMMKIYSNKLTSTSSDTKIGLKYGRLNARVKRIKTLKTSFKISTPVATSSVRGSEEEVFYGSKSGMMVWVLGGTIETSNPDLPSRFITGRSPSRAVFILKPGMSKPLNLLFNVTNASMVKIYADNTTDDEKGVHDTFGDELFDNTEGAVEFLDNLLKGAATVNVELIWP
jgi:hypothetical protein